MLYPQKPKITRPLKPMKPNRLVPIPPNTPLPTGTLTELTGPASPDKSMSKDPNKKLEAIKIALQKKAQMGRIKE